LADNVAITAGSGTTIATDDVGSGVQVQRVKVTFGADGTATDANASTPLPAAAPDLTASGSLTSTTSVTLTLASQSQVAVQVTGTFSATLQFEGTVDGTNFFSVPAIVATTGAVVTSATAVGQWLIPCAGYKQVRVRCSAFTSGTAVVSLQGSHGTQIVITTGTVTEQGAVAHDAPAVSAAVAPVLLGGYSSAAAPTNVSTDGDAVNAWFLANGAQCQQLTASGTLIAAGNGTAATSLRVTIASDSTGTVACTSATAANFKVQADHTLVDNAAFTDGTTRLGMAGFIFDETAGTALTENDGAAARVDSKRAQVMVVEDATTRGQRQAVSSAGAAMVAGVAAHGASVAGNPNLVGCEGRTAVGTAVTSGQTVRTLADVFGKQVVLVGGLLEERVSGYANYTTTAAADLIAAPGAGIRIAVFAIQVVNGHATQGTKVTIRSKTTTSNKFGPFFAAANGGGFSPNSGSVPLFIATANEAIEAVCGTTGVDVDVQISGYLIKN
jgi:hypothetical protein